MSVIPMSIGTVRLTGAGVPDEIVLGGDQRLVIHELPGGGRAVDVLGAQDRAIVWTGVFVGEDALQRALELDQLRRDGDSQTLAFETFQIDVMIERFRYGYARGGHAIAYEIRCQPLDWGPPVSDPLALVGASLSLASAVLAASGELADPGLAALPGVIAAASSRQLGASDLPALSQLDAGLAAIGTSGAAAIASISGGWPMTAPAIHAAVSGCGRMACGVIAGGLVGQAGLVLGGAGSAE